MTATPRLRRAWAGVAAWLSLSAVTHACPVCFQFDDPTTTAGVETAVVVLAGVTVSVLIPCAAFAVRLARRDTPSVPVERRDSQS